MVEDQDSLVAGFSARLALTLTGVRTVFVDLLVAPEGSGLGNQLWSEIERLAAGPVGGFILAETVTTEPGRQFWASKLHTTNSRGEGGSRDAQFLFLQMFAVQSKP